MTDIALNRRAINVQFELLEEFFPRQRADHLPAVAVGEDDRKCHFISGRGKLAGDCRPAFARICPFLDDRAVEGYFALSKHRLSVEGSFH